MTPERFIQIKQLLTHPCNLGDKWRRNLQNELLDFAEEKIVESLKADKEKQENDG